MVAPTNDEMREGVADAEMGVRTREPAHLVRKLRQDVSLFVEHGTGDGAPCSDSRPSKAVQQLDCRLSAAQFPVSMHQQG